MTTAKPRPNDLMHYLTILLALALGGCSSTAIRERAAEDAANVFPTNYKADLLAFMRSYLNDPTNVRDAAISEPRPQSFGPDMRYVACLRYNARDSTGKYSGTKDRQAVYFRGRFDRLIESGGDQCKEAAYQPFPELERLTR